MEINNKHHNNQFEINDLIDEAVNNAVARRQETLLDLSDEEAKNVAGGASLSIKPIILGRIFCPPITIGIIAVDPKIQTI
ncbi:hypothetical protein H6G54_07920 [Anabaena cylindrica FACHB-243]|uniref:Uncharacterized protein n=1 Tax=Anabaena cylindrica (strain ATCC 27899 / PCC 7122) TaxID=272123 RepID=K9ZJU2_ANACC|nr:MULTISPECIES: hypothetical protein [Anabaena]AFZ59476.1 hypothetical protein Anacy_4108 [Anabaena cylindrica PCC 7122]MBD2417631.1 hypothetical protein [Anabaena cylindrica FACHB-243]MBY5283251.1 hypothetical protein [Anabaena sp. CCAP 1446/1C]MBY5310631.1 hypothetical protein [Anabaena sp. CCAP 1446/1C]MCM2405392.1 hypothetical protein [Anabaena sp. CCAP 1446/1C]